MAGKWGPAGLWETVTELGTGFNTALPVLGTINMGPFDMRGFNGWYLRQDALTTGAAAYNAIRANMIWVASDDTASGSGFTSFRRDYEWWASTGGAPPAANSEGVFSGFLGTQGKCLGNNLATLSFSNFGTTACSITWGLYGTSRVFNDSFQTMSPYDDMLYENNNIIVPAGLGFQIPLPQFYGRMGVHRENIGAGPTTTMQIRWGSALSNYAYHTMISNGADGNPQNFEIVAPARPALVTLFNAAGGTTNRLVVTTQRDKI